MLVSLIIIVIASKDYNEQSLAYVLKALIVCIKQFH